MARDVDVLTEAVIRRPCPEVAGYAGDPTSAPEWYADIASVEWRTPPPLAVGATAAAPAASPARPRRCWPRR